MGVRGLQSFIKNNDDLLYGNCRLYNNVLVVDACNFVGQAFFNSQRLQRKDLFGGDMVAYGQYLRQFLGNLAKCGIAPIFVFDGAQTSEDYNNKTQEKYRRSLQRFNEVMKINQVGFGDTVLPATATTVLKSILTDKEIQCHQSVYEADADIARIANVLKCPVLSNDSDFFIFPLTHGLIMIQDLEFQAVRKDYFHHSDGYYMNLTSQKYRLKEGDLFFYISCRLYTQENFVSYFPGLEPSALPLLAILAGNDFISKAYFEGVCSLLPNPQGCGTRKMKKMLRSNKQHTKLLKVLFWLCGLTTNQATVQILNRLAQNDRKKAKQLILQNLKVYIIPYCDEFETQIYNCYMTRTVMNESKYHRSLPMNDDRIKEAIKYIRGTMEYSTMNYTCLELIFLNDIFVTSHMDDPKLVSAHSCQERPIMVMLALLRGSEADNYKFCQRYDRIGYEYKAHELYPLVELENFVSVNCYFRDLPMLNDDYRQQLLMTTFHSSMDDYQRMLSFVGSYLLDSNASEITLLTIIIRYIEIETNTRMWKEFKYATLLNAICYLAVFRKDSTFLSMVDEYNHMAHTLTQTIKVEELEAVPNLSNTRLYNCRLMHFITQLQSAIVSYNHLNALLGDRLPRMRPENWLNSCLIYNITEFARKKKFKVRYTLEKYRGFSMLLNYLRRNC